MPNPVYGTDAGNNVSCIFSGSAALSDQLIYSGQGRLDSVLPHVQTSGVQVVFYDAAVATSGGPFAASGHNILGVLPANTWAGGPGGGVFGAGPVPATFNTPFFSGLCVATKSGQPGFTATYTPSKP